MGMHSSSRATCYQRMAFACLVAVAVASEPYYGDPYTTGCRSDERPITFTNGAGGTCSPFCSPSSPCPTHVPVGTTAIPECAATLGNSTPNLCVLVCGNSGSVKCPPAATCQESISVCTYVVGPSPPHPRPPRPPPAPRKTKTTTTTITTTTAAHSPAPPEPKTVATIDRRKLHPDWCDSTCVAQCTGELIIGHDAGSTTYAFASGFAQRTRMKAAFSVDHCSCNDVLGSCDGANCNSIAVQFSGVRTVLRKGAGASELILEWEDGQHNSSQGSKCTAQYKVTSGAIFGKRHPKHAGEPLSKWKDAKLLGGVAGITVGVVVLGLAIIAVHRRWVDGKPCLRSGRLVRHNDTTAEETRLYGDRSDHDDEQIFMSLEEARAIRENMRHQTEPATNEQLSFERASRAQASTSEGQGKTKAEKLPEGNRLFLELSRIGSGTTAGQLVPDPQRSVLSPSPPVQPDAILLDTPGPWSKTLQPVTTTACAQCNAPMQLSMAFCTACGASRKK